MNKIDYMEKTFTLQSKIKVYSTIALSFSGLGALNSQIVYHKCIPPIILNGSNPTYNIDMDGDSTNDFQAQTDGVVRAQLNNLIPVNNGVAGYGSGAWFYAQAFASNQNIGASVGNWNNAGRNILASAYSLNSSGWGYFGDGQDHFAGVKFKIGSTLHYGWIRFSGIPNQGTTITIMDWAYNSVADTSILAGEGIVSEITENTSPENIAVFYFNKKLNINFLNANDKGYIKISNIMGQEIRNVGITATKMTIDLGDVSPGIYVVSINNDAKKITTHKFNVN